MEDLSTLDKFASRPGNVIKYGNYRLVVVKVTATVA